MGLGGILILLLLIVALIVFIYIIVMTARGWGVLHTILLCTLFIECWVFMIFSAGVQYRRVRYTKDAAIAQANAEKGAKETDLLLYGSFNAADESLEAVLPVKGMLRRLTSDRGRVWRQLNFVQANNGAYQLEMTANQPAADPLAEAAPAAAAPVNSESLPANLVVYAFAEEAGSDGYPKPVFYLGEFVVEQSQAGQITLKPTLPLRDFQVQRIASGGAPRWMLYELLPIDSHQAFAEPGSQATADELFGHMKDETINSLFADVPETNNLQSKITKSYLEDGQPASSDADPSTVWVQVNMLQNHDVDVDSQEEANATVGGYFDSIGRSVDSRLKRKGDAQGPVTLTPEMNRKLIVLKEEAAQELIASGKAELVQRFYVRPLNDYEEAFNRNIVREHELAERITLVKRESAEVAKANQLGNEMTSFRQVEHQKLQSDLSHFQQEIAVLNDAATQATQELTDLKERMSSLYRAIQTQRSQMSE